MLRFIDAEGRVHDAIDAATLCAAIRSADPEVWNGRFGRACLFFRNGDREQQLLVTVAPKLGYCFLVPRADEKLVSHTAEVGDDPCCWAGSPVNLAKSCFVPELVAERIVAHFCATGEPAPDTSWRAYPPFHPEPELRANPSSRFVRFLDASNVVHEPVDIPLLQEAVRARDRSLWIGLSGHVQLEYHEDARDSVFFDLGQAFDVMRPPRHRALRVALHPQAGYYIVFLFDDGSRCYAHNPAEAEADVSFRGTKVSRKRFQPDAAAERILVRFFLDGEPDPETEWLSL